MKKIVRVFSILALLLVLYSCDKSKIKITIDESISKEVNVSEDIDFKKYFTITDEKGNKVEVTDEMLNLDEIDLNKSGTYKLVIKYLEEEVFLNIVVKEHQYILDIVKGKYTTLLVNENVNLKSYFTIKNLENEEIEVTDEMLNLDELDLSKVGSYTLKLTYNGLVKEINISIVEKLATEVSITPNTKKEFTKGDKANFKEYFKIKNSRNEEIEVTDEMLNLDEVDLNKVGTYTLKLTYNGVIKEVSIKVNEKIEYELTKKDVELVAFVDSKIDFNDYFLIYSNLGEQVLLTNSMISSDDLDTYSPGSYSITIKYENINETFNFIVKENLLNEKIYEDFNEVIELIKNLELDKKGSAKSEQKIKVAGTIYTDVENEVKLVYITDGKVFIKLHGDRMHSYTSVGDVYLATVNYVVNIYHPSLMVSNLERDIKKYDEILPTTNFVTKKVTVEEITSLKRENFVSNLEKGYLQSLMEVSGYLQEYTRNNNNLDFAISKELNPKKNNTQYLENVIYFKNKDEILNTIFYGSAKTEITILGLMYEYNTNRKNFRFYIPDSFIESFK